MLFTWEIEVPLTMWNIFYYFFRNFSHGDTNKKVDLGNKDCPNTDPGETVPWLQSDAFRSSEDGVNYQHYCDGLSSTLDKDKLNICEFSILIVLFKVIMSEVVEDSSGFFFNAFL